MSEITQQPLPRALQRVPPVPHQTPTREREVIADLENEMARLAKTEKPRTLQQQVARLLLQMPLAEALDMSKMVLAAPGAPVAENPVTTIGGYAHTVFEHAITLNKWAQETVKGIPTP